MLCELVGHEPGVRPLKRLIAEKTEGNPFFVEEIVQTLFEQGFVVRNGGVALKRSLGQIMIPPAVQALLASRIDRLPPDEKVFLQMLAVLGREFSLTLLRRVARSSESELERILADLQHGEFIYEQAAFPDIGYSFKHALTHE